MKVNELDLCVRFVETDQMGVAHHSNFYSWFEMGRFHLTKSILQNSSKLIKNGSVLVPVITSQCRHYSFAEFDDLLRLKVKLKTPETAKLIFYYELHNQNSNKLVAIGKTMHVLINAEKNLLVTLPTVLKEDIELAQKFYPDCFTGGEEYEGKL